MEESSDLCAGLEDGNVPLRQMFCDFEPAGTEQRGSGHKGQRSRGDMNADVPALVGEDLLLDQLSIQTLRSLLRHRHQLDQLRPEGGGFTTQT